MNTTDLQENIIQKIRNTNDEELLNYLNQLLSGDEKQKTYKLSEFEKRILTESEVDYRAEKIYSNENIRLILYSRILSIKDEESLSEMISLIDKSDRTIYQTTPEQKASIKEGQEQITNGYFYTNEQVEKEIDEWLCKE
jgi:predicted transcriptional regulator